MAETSTIADATTAAPAAPVGEHAPAAASVAPAPPAEPTPEVVSADAPAAEVPSHLGLRRADQWLLGVTVGVAGLLMLVHWARLSGWGTRPVEIERLPQRRYDYRIDINTAGWVEWIQLPGIGETLAQRIVEDREQNGPFRHIDDLRRIKGLGPKTVESLRPWLKVEPVPRQTD